MIAVRHPTSAAEVYANAAAVRKRLFSPQRAPVKRAEPKPAPKAAPAEEIASRTVNGQIARLLRMGVTQANIARKTGASPAKVRKMAIRMGIATDPRPHCTEHADKIKELCEQGMSATAIAVEIGMSKGPVIKFIRKQGWKLTPRRPDASHYEAEIKLMFDDGVSIRAIAKSLGYDHSAIGRFIKRMGWKR